jgi:hypothetical protein
MARLRWAILILGLSLLAVAPSSGQDKKTDKEDTKARAALPPHWKDLNLTAEQKQKVYKIHDEYKPKIDELEKRIKDLKAEEYVEKVKVLTDDQKKKLKDTIVPDDKEQTKSIEGKLVKFADDKLTISVDELERQYSVKGVKPTVDGKEGKWEDVKPNAKISITEKDGKVAKVEVKNP